MIRQFRLYLILTGKDKKANKCFYFLITRVRTDHPTQTKMSCGEEESDQLLLELASVEAIKFGNFTLKSGLQSPVYFDLRVIVSYPNLMEKISKLLWKVHSH